MILVRTRSRFFLEIARCLKKLGVAVAVAPTRTTPPTSWR